MVKSLKANSISYDVLVQGYLSPCTDKIKSRLK